MGFKIFWPNEIIVLIFFYLPEKIFTIWQFDLQFIIECTRCYILSFNICLNLDIIFCLWNSKKIIIILGLILIMRYFKFYNEWFLVIFSREIVFYSLIVIKKFRVWKINAFKLAQNKLERGPLTIRREYLNANYARTPLQIVSFVQCLLCALNACPATF